MSWEKTNPPGLWDVLRLALRAWVWVLAGGARSFYDSGKSSRHPYGMEPLARVNNLDNVPMCAHWVRQPDFDMLLWGDDRGSINAFTFDDFWGGEVFNPGALPSLATTRRPFSNQLP